MQVCQWYYKIIPSYWCNEFFRAYIHPKTKDHMSRLNCDWYKFSVDRSLCFFFQICWLFSIIFFRYKSYWIIWHFINNCKRAILLAKFWFNAVGSFYCRLGLTFYLKNYDQYWSFKWFLYSRAAKVTVFIQMLCFWCFFYKFRVSMVQIAELA